MAQLNKDSRTGLTGQIRRVLLAGVGMAFLAKDEVSDFVDRLVEKGESAERDGRKLVSGLITQSPKGLAENGRKVVSELEKRTRGISKNVKTSVDTVAGVTKGLAGEVQTRINRRIDQVLHKMNLVSVGDVRDLNSKIDQLSRKLDRLGKK